MIPWVREKFAERRAKWSAARKKRSSSEAVGSADAATSVSNGNPAGISQDIIREAAVESQLLEHKVMLNDCRTGQALTPISTQKATSSVQNQFKLKNARRHQTLTTPCSSEETTLGRSKDKIRVRIICPSARVLIFQTDINKRIVELKNEIILELSDDPSSLPLFATDMRQLSPRYRLIKSDYDATELNESLSLAQYKVQDSDTLVLLARRSNLQQTALQSRDIAGPREQDIEKATRAIPPATESMPMVDINEIFQQSNLQFDVRKVLISLAQSSAAIIGSGPYANRLIAMLKQKLINKRNYRNDTLQCLVDMGFKADKAEYALRVHNGVYSTTLEWLIQHQSDENPSEEEPGIGMQKSRSVISPSGILTNDSSIENTQALLEIVRIYSHRDIPPTAETVSALVEMGFVEADVLNALKKTCNNKAAACEWLCGNRSGSLIELRDGLAQDSPILKIILELPQVQINLSNPKILLAFLSILENEQSIRVWGGDSDTTSVITHILQKYHEEKHVLGINQFYGNR